VIQVVDQDAKISLAAAGAPGFTALDFERGIGTGQQALGSGFFIAGGAVDLAAKYRRRWPWYAGRW